LELNDIIQISNCLRNLSRAKGFEGITSNKNYFIVELLQQIVKKIEAKNETISAFYNNKKFVAENSEFHFWLLSKIEKRKMKLVFEEIVNKKTLSN
jgi:hypothetical protein